MTTSCSLEAKIYLGAITIGAGLGYWLGRYQHVLKQKGAAALLGGGGGLCVAQCVDSIRNSTYYQNAKFARGFESIQNKRVRNNLQTELKKLPNAIREEWQTLFLKLDQKLFENLEINVLYYECDGYNSTIELINTKNKGHKKLFSAASVDPENDRGYNLAKFFLLQTIPDEGWDKEQNPKLIAAKHLFIEFVQENYNEKLKDVRQNIDEYVQLTEENSSYEDVTFDFKRLNSGQKNKPDPNFSCTFYRLERQTNLHLDSMFNIYKKKS